MEFAAEDLKDSCKPLKSIFLIELRYCKNDSLCFNNVSALTVIVTLTTIVTKINEGIILMYVFIGSLYKGGGKIVHF